MKLLYLLTFFPKISTTFITNEIAKLIDLNQSLSIFSMNKLEKDSVHNQQIHKKVILTSNKTHPVFFIFGLLWLR